MKFPFKELPGVSQDYLRPVVPVTVEGIARAPQLCLLDTGALRNRFGAWVAEAAGIDLTGVEAERVAIGGFVATARQSSVQLTLGDVTWEASVWFCDPWPLSFQLLGQEGFFRWFDVRMRAAIYEVEVTPELSAGDDGGDRGHSLAWTSKEKARTDIEVRESLRKALGDA